MWFKTLIVVLYSASAFALETDNYMTWKRELKDVLPKANTYLLQELTGVVERANKEEKPISCRTLTLRYANRFKTSPTNGHPLEHWAKENLNEFEIDPKARKFLDQTIYANPARFYLKYWQVAPTINVNGFYIGIDKLSHFASTGRRYLEQYLKLKKTDLEESEIHRKLVLFGLKNEASWLGYWPSGVFSYGDMEANYQGFLFFKSLCLQGDGLVGQDEQGKWQIQESPDLTPYVNGNWDETYNPSFRLKRSWVKVEQALKEQYCQYAHSERVEERFSYYAAHTQKSFSKLLIEEMQARGSKSTPIPQTDATLDNLCR